MILSKLFLIIIFITNPDKKQQNECVFYMNIIFVNRKVLIFFEDPLIIIIEAEGINPFPVSYPLTTQPEAIVWI